MRAPYLDDGDVRPAALREHIRFAMNDVRDGHLDSIQWNLEAMQAILDACESRSWPFAPDERRHRLVPDPEMSP